MRISLQDAAAKLKVAQKIVVTAHQNPDGDALGSSLGMYWMLKKLGKDVQVVIDDDIPENFSFLPGVEKITKADDEIYGADLLVLLDVSMDRVGRVTEKCQAPILNIDHHRTNDEKADFLYLDAECAAAAQLVYRLLPELAVETDADIAQCIFTGLSTDTGSFRYSNTTAETMHAAADMIAAGAKPVVVSESLEKRTYKSVMDRAKAMQTIEMAMDGKVAGVYIGNELYSELDTTEGFIDGVRIIDTVDVAVLIKEVEPGICRVSMRSRGTDVSAVAASLGGGGHIRAAGCTIEKPLAEAKEILLAELSKVIAD